MVLVWIFVSVLGAWALGNVVGVLNPHEKVNGLWLVVAAGSVMAVARLNVAQDYL